MMSHPYCAVTDIQKVMEDRILIELTDDARANSRDDDIINFMIESSDALIDGWLQQKHLTPVEDEDGNTPNIIRQFSVDLTIYFLFGRRPSLGIPEDRQVRYDQAVMMLKEMASGEMRVGTDPPPSPSTAQIATTDGPTRVFTKDTMVDF